LRGKAKAKRIKDEKGRRRAKRIKDDKERKRSLREGRYLFATHPLIKHPGMKA
jgi:hypothetical protein